MEQECFFEENLFLDFFFKLWVWNIYFIFLGAGWWKVWFRAQLINPVCYIILIFHDIQMLNNLLSRLTNSICYTMLTLYLQYSNNGFIFVCNLYWYLVPSCIPTHWQWISVILNIILLSYNIFQCFWHLCYYYGITLLK